MPTKRPRSLTQRTIWIVALRIGIVVVVATVVSYWHVYSGLKQQALDQLASYVEERRVRESMIFTLARDNLETFVAEYQRHMTAMERSDPSFRFDKLFVTLPDGTTRLDKAYFAEKGITAFVGKHVTINKKLQRRLLTGLDVLERFGPAWRSRFANLYVVSPEGAVLMYWPDQPWALNASDWEIHSKLALSDPTVGDIVVTGKDSPARPDKIEWSKLYFDYGVNDWLVSAALPINRRGAHFLSVGHDILLHDLIERAVRSDIDGAYNVIFRDDGRLIAHPKFMDAIMAQSGGLRIQDAGDAHLQRVFDLASRRAPDDVLVENRQDDEHLAVTQLTGPGWYLVTVFPNAAISARAFDTARLVLILGAVALLLEIGILATVLRKQVAAPLKRLMRATENVASGEFNADLDVERNDELGRLARSFNSMAREVDARERKLSENSALLANLNKQLERELAERHRAEDEVARQREALYQSEKMNALGTLLAGVAHELNNPLSVVVGRANLLEEQVRDAKTRGSVDRIKTAAERCARIVKTFLAMARRQPPARGPVRVDDLIRGSFEVVGYCIESSGIRVEESYDTAAPETFADGDQLTQVFTNLILNAQHALLQKDGERIIRVATVYDETVDAVIATVEDNGPGIPEDIQSRIFDPFFTTKPTGVGTGIGLSVCRGIVESHGGAIEVGTAALGGAAFTVRLPIVARDAVEKAAAESPANGMAEQSNRVLVVDDEAEVGSLIREILLKAGHEVETTTSPRAALELLNASSYDVVISDIVMPELSGPALHDRIKSTIPGPQPRVVFITGDSMGANAADFLEKGKHRVIMKPFTAQAIREAVLP